MEEAEGVAEEDLGGDSVVEPTSVRGVPHESVWASRHKLLLGISIVRGRLNDMVEV